jgi:hypothetical protein
MQCTKPIIGFYEMDEVDETPSVSADTLSNVSYSVPV